MGSLSVLSLQLLREAEIVTALQKGCEAFLEALKEGVGERGREERGEEKRGEEREEEKREEESKGEERHVN